MERGVLVIMACHRQYSVVCRILACIHSMYMIAGTCDASKACYTALTHVSVYTALAFAALERYRVWVASELHGVWPVPPERQQAAAGHDRGQVP